MAKWKVIQSPTIRGIVDEANKLGIKKEDVILFTEKNGIQLLVYYGEE